MPVSATTGTHRHQNDNRVVVFSSAHALDDHRQALAATDTHGLHADVLVAGLQAVNQGGHNASTSHTEWVTECDCSTIDVQLVH